MMDEVLKKLASSKSVLVGGIYINEDDDGLPKSTMYQMPKELSDFIKDNEYFNEEIQENINELHSVFKELFNRLEEQERKEEETKADSGKNIIYLGD